MFLAKMADDIEAKKAPNYIAIWKKEDVPTKLWPLKPLSKVWGISTGYEKRLNIMGIYSVYDLAHFNKDILIKVDDVDISDKTLTEVSSLVKGKAGTKVRITVLRDDEEKTFEVKRKSIDITSVTSDIIEYKDSKVGVLTISLFAANTNLQFEKELKELENKKIDSLIIDVRGNSGGYLNVVSDILSHFIKKGELLYQLKTKDEIEKIYDKTEDKRNYKVAVLVNGGSASASELLASCMKDTYKAYTVGTVTYGKSKVQKTQDLSNGATIKFTFQEWLMPSGESVGGKGMEPEYVVPYESSDTEHEYDSQMQKALDLLTEE